MSLSDYTDAGGEIMFDNMADERFLLNKIEENDYNTRSFIFETENKMIIFFPSDIHHKIAENKTNKDRLSFWARSGMGLSVSFPCKKLAVLAMWPVEGAQLA